MQKIKIIALASLSSLIPASLAQAAFRDVDVTHPYFHAIDSFQSRGLIKGYPNQNNEYFFRPLQKLNRAEALKIIWEEHFGREALRENLEQNFHSTLFPDVPQEAWFAPTINAAASAQIVQGFPDGNFHPGAQVTRAQFLSMVIKAYQIPQKINPNQTPQETSDIPWYDTLIHQAQSFNLLPQKQNQPHQALSRAEAIEILYRASFIHTHNFQKNYHINGTGIASFYHDSLSGNPTASGPPYNPEAFTAAHRTLPFGTKVKIHRPQNPETFITVEINDRGPYHEDRILDLSRAAFEALAHEGEGIIKVHFEVIPHNQQAQKIIPTDIANLSSQESTAPIIPSDIAEIRQKTPSTSQKKKTTNIKKYPVNFYQGITLRNPFPAEIQQGQVLNFSGITEALEAQNGDQVTFFIKNFAELSSENPHQEKSSSQQIYPAKLSGRNFSQSIIFDQKGKWALGATIDGKKYSRVAQIDVTERQKNISAINPQNTKKVAPHPFKISLTPDDQFLQISWKAYPQITSKIIFSQEKLTKTLYIPQNVGYIQIPLKYFQKFQAEKSAKIELFQSQENGAYHKIHHENYHLARNFPHKIDQLQFPQFPQFLRQPTTQNFQGKTQNATVKLNKNVYITHPDGTVHTPPLTQEGRHFSFQYPFQKHGTYLVEILKESGEILYNQPLYIQEKFTLPLINWPEIHFSQNTKDPVIATLNSINHLRKQYQLPPLQFSGQLNILAQSYAQEMQSRNFIGHTSPSGKTFNDRIKEARLKGKFGENLSQATTLPLGLEGLENSGSHRQNIINPEWNKIGIGLTYDPTQKLYFIVQIFGK